jgi:uncharacterized protein
MLRETWYKVKFHLFEFEGDKVVFDIYRGRPYLIEPPDKAVLRMRVPIDEARTIRQLGVQFSEEIIRNSIQKLKGWGLLLREGEPLPDRPQEPDYTKITHLELNIAEDCNIRCTYCCVGQGSFGADQNNGRFRANMSWDVTRRSIDLLFEESLDSPGVHIRFFGGEPMMNWAIIQKSVHYAEEKAHQTGKGVSFSIVTNGTLLHEQVINFMKAHNFSVQISLDGTKEMHDAFRVGIDGKGTYEKATACVPQLLEALGPENVHARATLTHFNPDALVAFDHLRGLGFTNPRIKPVTGHDPAYGMTVKDYYHINEIYGSLAKNLLESDLDEVANYINLFFNDYIPVLMSGQARKPPCGAARNMIGVSTDGTILPCTDMVGKDHTSLWLGDINTGLQREKKQQFLNIVDVDNKDGCRKCWARYLCGGACASVELGNEGGLEQNAGLECIWIRHVIELSLWLYVKMLNERPELFYELYGSNAKILLGPLAEVFAINERS